MLRRDYMLKLIEQFAKMVAKLLDSDFENETEAFYSDFNSLLKDYFKINPDELNLLLKEDAARDAMLLDEHSKNSQLLLFARSGFVFAKKGETERARICMEIIERIKTHHSSLFEFPNSESLKIDEEISKLAEILKK